MKRFVVALAAVLSSCDLAGLDCDGSLPPDQSSRVTIDQGLWGQVVLWEGDFMPGPGCSDGSIDPVERTMLIYEATPRAQTQPGASPAFFSAVSTQLVDSVKSDARGFFQTSLPPGTYSVFTRENGVLYANSIEMPGEIIQPMTVEVGKVTGRRIDINYRASF